MAAQSHGQPVGQDGFVLLGYFWQIPGGQVHDAFIHIIFNISQFMCRISQLIFTFDHICSSEKA